MNYNFNCDIPLSPPPGDSFPFGLYPQFPPAAMLSPRQHPTYYPQPILYWSYPSPPVSPNTYFAPHPHHASNPHLNHNGLTSPPQPGMVR